MRPDDTKPFPSLLASLSEQGNDRAKVFATILAGQASSRKELTDLLSIRSTSISGYVSELLDLQLVAETLGPRIGRGRPSHILVANTNSLITLVFHVISQSLHVVAVNMAEQILHHEYELAGKECGNSDLSDKFRILFDRIMNRIPKTSRIAGIAFSLSGLIDEAACEWTFSSRWPHMRHLAIRHIFPDLKCPIAVSRNMDSELRARLYRSSKNTLLLHWGYGIGAAFGTNTGHIITGTDGFGEIGHWHINGEEASCRCGRLGCLETVAALWSIGPHLLGKDFNIGDDEDKLATQLQILDMTRFEVVDKALHHIVVSLSNLCRIFFPQKIIISGPMMANATIWARFCEQFLRENVFIHLQQPELVIGQESRRYELLGAAGPIFEQSLHTILADQTER